MPRRVHWSAETEEAFSLSTEAMEAKHELVSQYLHLAKDFERCSAAIVAYANAINEARDTREVDNLLRAPLGTPMKTGMPQHFPFLADAGNGGNNKRSRSEDEAEDEPDLDENRSKKRPKQAKKVKDPDAPKRPPSAYILFQNEVRHHVKASNPGVPYIEILQKISEQWKAAIQAALTAKPKKEKKQTVAAAKKEAAANAAAAAAASTSAPIAVAAPAAPAKKERKKEAAAKPKRAAASAAASTPAGTNAPLPKPASVPAKKNALQTTQETLSEEENSSDNSSSSDDE